MAPTIFIVLALLSIAESTVGKGGGLKLELIQRRLSPGNVSPMAAKSQIWPETSEFIVKIAVGTPPTEVHAILDTGSDLFWAQCRPCAKCYPANESDLRPFEIVNLSNPFLQVAAVPFEGVRCGVLRHRHV
ncbi:putative aspartic protease, partial [Cucurbita argyrosperma subsp. sororia]